MGLSGIILAAGKSSRMGTPKALLRAGDRTFLEIIHERMRAAGVGRVVAVVGEAGARIREEVRANGLEWVVNDEPERGQLSSLWCGLRAIAAEAGALVALVDHPLVKVETYVRLIDSFMERPQAIVIPTLASRRGHPIVFGSEQFARFLAAPLEVGARWVIEGGEVPVREVPVEDAGVRADIDTPEDYGRWVAEGMG